MTCYWSFKTVWKASVVVLSRYRFIFKFYAKSIHSFSLGRCQGWLSNALMRVVALMAFFCSIHSFLCKCGDRMERLDRYLTSEGCNTFSMVKTSGKAQCAPYYKNTITYSTSVYYYYKSLLSKSLTINNFYVEATHSERCTLEDLYSYFYYYNVIIIVIIIILITFTSIILITIIAIITIIIITITGCCRTN